MHKLISESIDHLTNKKYDDFTASFTSFVKERAASIINDNRVAIREAAFEQMKVKLVEMSDLPLEFRGDDVFIKGRKVGTVTHDLNDFDAGINFTSEDGTFSKEFDTLEDLSKYLMARFTANESLVLLGDDELATVVSETISKNEKLLKKTKSLTESTDFTKMAKYVLDKEHEFRTADKATLIYIGKTLEKKWKS